MTRKCLHVFDILPDCVDKSCVCQLSLNEYDDDDDDDDDMMMMIMQIIDLG